jgi:hypothetical protein
MDGPTTTPSLEELCDLHHARQSLYSEALAICEKCSSFLRNREGDLNSDGYGPYPTAHKDPIELTNLIDQAQAFQECIRDIKRIEESGLDNTSEEWQARTWPWVSITLGEESNESKSGDDLSESVADNFRNIDVQSFLRAVRLIKDEAMIQNIYDEVINVKNSMNNAGVVPEHQSSEVLVDSSRSDEYKPPAQILWLLETGYVQQVDKKTYISLTGLPEMLQACRVAGFPDLSIANILLLIKQNDRSDFAESYIKNARRK